MGLGPLTHWGTPASCSSSVIRLTASSLKGVGFAPPTVCSAGGLSENLARLIGATAMSLSQSLELLDVFRCFLRE